VVILTGVSGSGKSTALRALEDAGWYCVDNLPVVLLEKLVELSQHAGGQVSRLALVVDARDERFLPEAPRVIEEVRRQGARVDVLFLEASDEALLRRYSETRRRHPMAGEGGTVPEGIAAERRALEPLKTVAGEVVDSTQMTVHELKKYVHDRFVEPGAAWSPSASATGCPATPTWCSTSASSPTRSSSRRCAPTRAWRRRSATSCWASPTPGPSSTGWPTSAPSCCRATPPRARPT
jgi:chloramphenicol 3-O-phosphotransferase